MECDTKSEITAKNVTHRKRKNSLRFDHIEVNIYSNLQHKNVFKGNKSHDPMIETNLCAGSGLYTRSHNAH